MSSEKRWTTRIFRHIQTLLPQKENATFKTSQGMPHPYGVTPLSDGLNFALFSQHSQSVELVLFTVDNTKSPMAILSLDPLYNRTGDIWHIMVYDLPEALLYAWRCQGPSDPKHRFQPKALLIDPYAYALSGGFPWGNSGHRLCRVVREDNTKHKQVRVRYHRSESILYELHVRGFTAHPSAQVANPGTFSGLKEKIPYLAKLGITSVELLPIAEFPENEISFKNPQTGEPLKNLWGYNSLAFFAPKAGYSSTGDSRAEFRELVQEFHKANIEVILDVVFNHTAEGDESGPTLSFRGIDNSIYYLLDKEGRYLNYSGCGNTVKCNHPVVRELILDCLRHWVLSFQVDGFRFDLGSILSRDEEGHLLSNTPLLEQISRDPFLSQTKIIMEAWDAGGGYQVGQLTGKGGRFCEWNDRFRDDVRKFWRGDFGMTKALAIRFLGSPDLYPAQDIPHHSINFVTCHDGFTLMDLVSYQQKHNEANGEKNRDGSFENYSLNHGVEGPTDDLLILRHRDLKRRGLLATLLLSQGIPMLLAGDEFGRTQQGNNNAYCQDNEISWIQWDLLATEAHFFRWVQQLITFRKKHPLLRRPSFLKQDQGEVSWFDGEGRPHSFSENSRTLGILLNGTVQKEQDDDLYLVFHNESEQKLHPIPPPPSKDRGPARSWLLVADSTRNTPKDFLDSGQEEPLPLLEYLLTPYSVLILRAPRKG